MNYPQLTGEPNFVLIGVSAVFGLLVIIMVYYIFISKNTQNKKYNKSGSYAEEPSPSFRFLEDPSDAIREHARRTGGQSGSTSSTSGNPIITKAQNQGPVPINSGGNYASVPTSAPAATVSNPNIKQVFNIKNNIYTLDDSGGVCGALGADVATIEQLITAHKNGADWCNVGWTKDGLAAYPIQYDTWLNLQGNTPDKRNICGAPGINLARNDPNLLYGVNCYGVKPEPKGNEKVKQQILNDSQMALNAKIALFQKNINAIGVAPFNSNSWTN
jgi:hypothetical protein